MTTLGVFFIILVCFSCVSQAFNCCFQYRRNKIPALHIKNYYLQKSTEVCDIDAVVFTVSNPCESPEKIYHVCADPKQDWVTDRLKAFKSQKRRLTNKRLKKICRRKQKTQMFKN